MAAIPTLRNGSTLETGGNPADNPALRRFALLTAAATFALVWMGGLVTSHGAGLAVPDWPNTYGYNLFFFPFSKWIGGIFFEHTHRLVASGVGLLTTILALWLYGYKSRPLLRWGGGATLLAGLAVLCFPPQSPHSHTGENIMLACIGAAALASSFVWPKCEPSPKWLRRLGVAAFFAVVAQGVLGGLRVTLLKDELGIFHATLAQLFFVLMSAMVLFQTAFWRKLPAPAESDARGLRHFFLAATLLILGQLALGATMRHQHAGLAIPDFPAAYGKIWPDTDAASVVKYNQLRMEVQDYPPITAFQILLQMVHRLMAGIVLVMVGTCAWLARRQLGPHHRLSRLAAGWFCLIVAQIILGAATIWTGKKADIATAHVACGALSLALGGLISIIAFRRLAAPAGQNCPAQKDELTTLLASSRITLRS
ncbi:MAG: COX15/CtaA family protein [Verrucomicrobiota bacterium]|jgi:cytochrome c oxidase assembly protein subunit 15